MKFCPYCGASLPGGAASFCPECGKPLPVGNTAGTQEQEKRRPQQKPKQRPRPLNPMDAQEGRAGGHRYVRDRQR